MIPTINTQRIKLILRKYKTSLLLTGVLSVAMLIFLTGIVVFTHAVYVYDGEKVGYYFTMLDNPHEILEENGYILEENDEVEASDFLFSTASITIKRSFDVIVFDESKKQIVPMTEGTVQDALEKCGLSLGEFDEINIPLEGLVDEETVVAIQRAFDVNINVDDTTKVVPMISGTAEQAIAAAGVFLSTDDIVSAELKSEVQPDMEITINRVVYNNELTTEAIPYETIKKYLGTMAKGVQRINTQGKDGEKKVLTRQTIIDGVVTTEEVISTEVTVKPVDEVIDIGTALNPIISVEMPDHVVLDENGIPLNYTKVITGKSAAYTASKGAKTASGRLATIGTVAVNPNIIPYGTELYIVSTNGKHVYGYAIAADTGIALMDGRILVDLYMGDRANHYDDSCRWGIKVVNVYILE
ncbi:MAG TPA: G5 domain-containing protein [Oscillospiraceae bacterium]|nr:G5 domain-containing protein [Oscillospiraceae bacterium]